MRSLSEREQKLLALGLLVAGIALVWLGIVSPLAGGFAARAEERERLTLLYGRNQRLIASTAAWRAQLDRQAGDQGRYAVAAPTETLAADLLRERIVREFAPLGAEIRSVQGLPTDNRKGWVAVRADLRLTLAQLDAGLARLENEEPYVVIDYFAVAAERAFETGRSGPVDVRIDVSARVRPPPRAR